MSQRSIQPPQSPSAISVFSTLAEFDILNFDFITNQPSATAERLMDHLDCLVTSKDFDALSLFIDNLKLAHDFQHPSITSGKNGRFTWYIRAFSLIVGKHADIGGFKEFKRRGKDARDWVARGYSQGSSTALKIAIDCGQYHVAERIFRTPTEASTDAEVALSAHAFARQAVAGFLEASQRKKEPQNFHFMEKSFLSWLQSTDDSNLQFLAMPEHVERFARRLPQLSTPLKLHLGGLIGRVFSSAHQKLDLNQRLTDKTKSNSCVSTGVLLSSILSRDPSMLSEWLIAVQANTPAYTFKKIINPPASTWRDVVNTAFPIDSDAMVEINRKGIPNWRLFSAMYEHCTASSRNASSPESSSDVWASFGAPPIPRNTLTQVHDILDSWPKHANSPASAGVFQDWIQRQMLTNMTTEISASPKKSPTPL
jgi:hypothetical protein